MKVVPLYGSSGNGHPAHGQAARLVAALDVGSSKISCMIGEMRGLKRRSGNAVPALRITGVGVQAARGVRGGVVTDAGGAERAVRRAVDSAERMAGVTLEEVFVNISGGRPLCETLTARMDVPGGGPVDRGHVAQVVSRALNQRRDDRREVVHVTPAQFVLDGGPGVPRAEGMYADSLAAHVNVVSVERGPLRNLEQVIARCMLKPAGFLVAPYAAARAVLVKDEIELGVTVIEIGAANTSVAVFAEGRLEHACVIPVGSAHITSDIAIGLGTSLEEAERLKTLNGSVLPGVEDDLEDIGVSMLGESGPDASQRLPRSYLNGVIRPRAEEILELARDEIMACPAARNGRRVVLTGGGCQLVGMREMAERVLERTVRIGAPRQIAGMPQGMETPAFAVVAGLLRGALESDSQSFLLPPEGMRSEMRATGTDGYFSRVKQWINQSF